MPCVHLQRLAIDGVYRATPAQKGARTFDWFQQATFAPALPAGWCPAFGTTYTALPGQVIGLYPQAGHSVMTCAAGRVALVVVDLRVGAPTFGRWIPIGMDTVERATIIVPPDTAWGFQAVSPGSALLSLHTRAPDGLVIDAMDAALQIAWPLSPTTQPGTSLSDAIDVLPVFKQG